MHELLRPREWLQAAPQGPDDSQVQARNRVLRHRSLFEFDARLRGVFMEAIVRVERKLRSSVSYAFCSREGSAQERYLDSASYSAAKKHRNGVARLVRIMEGIAVRNDECPYITHCRVKHGNVPLWATMNAMTFGQTSKMYSYLRHPMQADVAKQYENVNERELG